MNLKIYNIGTRGGAVRPSSGYAFTFIQKQAFQIISQIKNRKKLILKFTTILIYF